MAERNILYERHRFYQRCQQSEESLQSFVQDVRLLAEACAFTQDAEGLVRDRVLFGLHNENAKWQIINDGGDPTVSDVVMTCRLIDESQQFEHYELATCVKNEPEESSNDGPATPIQELSNDEDCGSVEDIKHEVEEETTIPDPQPASMPAQAIGASTNTSDSSAISALAMTKTKVPCPLCQKPCTPAYMKAHMQNVHQQSGDISVPCKVCAQMVAVQKMPTHLKWHKIKSLSQGGLRCYNCQETFVTAKELNQHLQRHTELDPDTKTMRYLCIQCNRHYVDVKQLRAHFKKAHHESEAEQAAYECKDCDMTFDTKNKWDRHKFTHMPCDICNKYVSNQFQMKMHIRTHRKDMQFECFICHKRCKFFRVLSRHVPICAMRGQFQCEVCLRKFKTIHKLRAHEPVHQGKRERRFNCEKCNRWFVHLDAQQRHMASHRQCKICDKEIIGDLNMRYHKLEHLDGYAFECFMCQRRFLTFHQVQFHMAAVHTGFVKKPKVPDQPEMEKTQLCPQCGKCFRMPSHLRRHMMRDDHQLGEGSGIAKPHECTVCGKRYAIMTGLADHMRTHTGDLPFKCEICGKGLPTSSSLHEHRNGVHLHKDRYKCNACSFACYKMCALKKHMLIHQSN